MLSQRAITGCYKDRGITFASGRGFAQWRRHDEELQAARGRPAELTLLARRLGADYLVLAASAPDAAPAAPEVYRNAQYRVLQVLPGQR